MKPNAPLRTDELLLACRQQGLNVTEPKARYWRRRGWLPPPQKRAGRGQGKGRERATWDASCVDRCRIILADPRNAAANLFANGYWVWDGSVPRSLSALAELIEDAVFKRRGFLDKDKGGDTLTKLLSLQDSVARRHKEVPPSLIQVMSDFTVGIAGLSKLLSDSSYAAVANFFSRNEILKSVRLIPEDDLENIHKSARGYSSNLYVLAGLLLFGTLSLSQDNALNGTAGPPLTLTGMAIPTYRIRPDKVLGNETLLKIELVALLLKVIETKHELAFRNAIFGAAISWLSNLTIPSLSAADPLAKALKDITDQTNKLIKKG